MRSLQSGRLGLSLDGAPQLVDDGELFVLSDAAANVGGVYTALRDAIRGGFSSAADFDYAVGLMRLVADLLASSATGTRKAALTHRVNDVDGPRRRGGLRGFVPPQLPLGPAAGRDSGSVDSDAKARSRHQRHGRHCRQGLQCGWSGEGRCELLLQGSRWSLCARRRDGELRRPRAHQHDADPGPTSPDRGVAARVHRVQHPHGTLRRARGGGGPDRLPGVGRCPIRHRDDDTRRRWCPSLRLLTHLAILPRREDPRNSSPSNALIVVGTADSDFSGPHVTAL